VKILSNPIMLRMALVFVAAGFAFVMGLLMMRRMRRSITDEISFSSTPLAPQSFPLQTYHAVIQQLKQQTHELLSSQREERRRAKTSENISVAVLSNLSCGVLFITSNGLVRQANTSAKQILGFASPTGMSASEIFRSAELISASDGGYTNLAAAIEGSVREKIKFRQLEAAYLTPTSKERTLDITVSSVQTPEGDFLGTACLITDRTELTRIRRAQDLRGEMSAEMALELRTSLTTISGYAQQLAASRDAELAHQLAADIAAEAAQLDRTIGGFLASAKGASAGATL